MKNFNKIMQSIFKEVIRPKIFFLFAFLFSSQAFAELSVTWLDGRIPAQNSNILECRNSDDEFVMSKDSTEDPYDVAFSTDGLQVFSVNYKQESVRKEGNLSMNRLTTPFDVTTNKRKVFGDVDCNNFDSFKVSTIAGLSDANDEKLRNIVVADEGSKFFISNNNGKIMRFDLSTPNEFKTRTFVNSVLPHAEMHGFAFSDDGTKLITIRYTANTPLITTYQLPNPYDISSITQIHQVDLTDIGLTLPTGGGNNLGRDIEFSKSGHAMFVLIQYSVATPEDKSDIYHFNLEKKFDVSTATLVGNYDVNNFQNQRDLGLLGYPIGFTFSSDGMRVFIVDIAGDASNGIDQINSYQLECPYGLVACVSDPTASISSQVELAKQNITQNISVIFKRFEWIKRNRDNEDFPSHKITINYPNPLLKSLVSKFEPSFKNNLAALVRNTEKKEKKKKSKWSSWGLVDISISNLSKNGFENAKNIRSEGLTFGFDRKFGDNKFLGWALRYGDSKSNIHNSKQNTDLESLTFNLYGIVPTNENRYINVVLGLSALRYDNKYLGKLSGKRTGRQAFTSINYRTQNTYGNFNLTPTGKFTLGVTRLSDYTDFISTTINGSSSTTDVKYAEDTFGSGEVAAGFLFDMNKIEVDQGTLQPMGGIEILYDLTPNVDYKYKLQGATPVNRETIIGSYSKRSLKTNIGFELIYLNGFTISPSYEKVMSLSDNERIPGERKKTYSEKFIIKLSRSKEEKGSEFAFDFDPLTNDSANLSYAKDIGNFNLKLNSNYSSINRISDYGANIELSGTF